MKAESKKVMDDFLSHKELISDDLMDEAEEVLGTMPFMLPILRERPEYFVLSSLADFMVGRPQHLDPKTAELIAIAAAAGAGAESCAKLHMKAAQKEGASREEIFDTILIACLIGKTKVMAPALRIFAEVVPKKD
jgi:4-carboxymuconolactone decarboxylase